MVKIDAGSHEYVDSIRELFMEYAASLDFDLDFQDFEDELEGLPGDYEPPGGRILLAIHGEELAGCVALREINEEVCEMKRLYVRPGFRGMGIGRELSIRVIDKARESGYERMRLDTVSSMREANSLYHSLGFEEIDPYRFNPLEGARFMELRLDAGDHR